jgi:predicted lipoprotein
MVGATSPRRYVRIGVLAGILVVLVILWFSGLLATVRPIGSAQTIEAVMEGGTAFDKVKFVDSIWESKVIPTVDKNAVALDTLVPAIQKNADAAAKQYGNNIGGAYNFMVQFSGKVGKVDTSSLTGTVTVDADYAGAMLPVKIQIGPIILGTALRDAVRFITFEQFTNQMQYGGVSDELNSRVTQNVISKLSLKSLVGKRLSVKGAFTYDGTNAKNILVTPVIVKVDKP